VNLYRNGVQPVGGAISNDSQGGLAAFDHLLPGWYELRVNSAERNGHRYAPLQLFGIRITPGQKVKQVVELSEGRVLGSRGKVRQSDLGSEQDRGRLDVTVVDSYHRPVGTWVNIYRNGVQPVGGAISNDGQGGLATFSNLLPGDYEVRVNAFERDGQKFAPKQVFGVAVAQGNRTRLSLTASLGTALLMEGHAHTSDLGTYPDRGRLDVRVNDAYHRPVGTWVNIYRNGVQPVGGTISNDGQGGLATFSDLIPGDYEVRVNAMGRNGQQFSPAQIFGVEVRAGGATVQSVSLPLGVDLQRVGGCHPSDMGSDSGRGRIDVVVTDSYHRAVGTWVNVYQGGVQAVGGVISSDGQGGLGCFPNLAPGIYEVRITGFDRDGQKFGARVIPDVAVVPGACTQLKPVLAAGSGDSTAACEAATFKIVGPEDRPSGVQVASAVQDNAELVGDQEAALADE
jgi:hypothetical protein